MIYCMVSEEKVVDHTRNLIDYTSYNEGMRKSLLDKIFFMDKINAGHIVDYGCADGTLIRFLHNLFPELYYIGYDIDPVMIQKAQESLETNNVLFTTDWRQVEDFSIVGSSALILSSVIHEVYSYGIKDDVKTFWNNVWNSKWDYIIIRDMIPSQSIEKQSDIDDVRRIMAKADKGMLADFERIWGSIRTNKNLMHFLLKYKYTENWSREVKENYFPLTEEELLTIIPDNYNITYYEHFVLPHLKRTVKADFGVDIKDAVHLKMILERGRE